MDKVRAVPFVLTVSPFLIQMVCKHSYINETIKEDCTTYKLAPIVNPFLTDFTAETVGSARGHNDEDVPALGDIESMQGILGIL